MITTIHGRIDILLAASNNAPVTQAVSPTVDIALAASNNAPVTQGLSPSVSIALGWSVS